MVKSGERSWTGDHVVSRKLTRADKHATFMSIRHSACCHHVFSFSSILFFQTARVHAWEDEALLHNCPTVDDHESYA